MHNHTCCICLAFLHCGFSNVSSHLFKNFKSPSAFCLKTASKTDSLLQMQIVKGFNAEYQTSFHHLQLESRPPGHSDQLPGDLLHFYFEFQSILSKFLAGVFAVSVTSVFTRMYFNMLPQTDCPGRCKVTLVAFV